MGRFLRGFSVMGWLFLLAVTPWTYLTPVYGFVLFMMGICAWPMVTTSLRFLPRRTDGRIALGPYVAFWAACAVVLAAVVHVVRTTT